VILIKRLKRKIKRKINLWLRNEEAKKAFVGLSVLLLFIGVIIVDVVGTGDNRAFAYFFAVCCAGGAAYGISAVIDSALTSRDEKYNKKQIENNTTPIRGEGKKNPSLIIRAIV
jgi:hypothetical protein